MLLKITSHSPPATDIGYLLGKHPDKVQSTTLPFGTAHVFYPEANETRCSVALMVDVDPVWLVRGTGERSGPLAQYVNDRPYTASSLLAVTMARVFASAMSGHSATRPELAAMPLQLEAQVPVVRCRAGEATLRRMFEPLGYDVHIAQHALDEQHPEWGQSGYFSLTLAGTLRLADLLTHLYVLLPAIDGDKHYFISDDEVQKLVNKGGDWLRAHPEREWIMRGYLKRQRSLVREALGKLMADSDDEADTEAPAADAGEHSLERSIGLNEQRLAAVQKVLVDAGAKSVLDLGCGEGRLLGIDVSFGILERAAKRLAFDRMPPMKRARIDVQHGSLTYRDARFEGFDAACAIEVIEHIDAERLGAFEQTVFEFARPGMVVLTTPNVEYNARFASLPAGAMRHDDHRFEWTRAQFEAWARGVAQRHGYRVTFAPVGPIDVERGAPTQMGVFQR
ncbi:HEN1 C-terminal domain double-stranded RNA 3'-methylase [Candidatus Burkholderia verschuerenii]|uniref:Small RNA 2'-O-methyltransferase n=1 Tax=Candidatus Burkholderia verschuerenii TaxID=242163 RepID=A0A0L0ME27_9BURK|nr:3' terminal RNA ribose 2'-O-methyltransferase Hen1 [Candidatus Burkholderia verschuerenii]KND60530.1 HEN1 C-terminal domain double-stranded RNA 3'-methylase [Candidatus Burkholderia verschuerenii]